MSGPVLALRAAIRARCLPDPALAAAMGGTVRIDDEPPRGVVPVYCVFGEVAVRDASTSSDRGDEQELGLVVWAAPGSAAGGLAAADRLAALLDDAPLTLAGHRLVHLSVTGSDTGRDRGTGLARVTLRLRAVTEALA